MSLTVTADGGGAFELVEAGAHLATCYRIIDLGTQKSTFEGKEKEQPKVRIEWEFAHEKMADGRPFVIGKEYTASLGEKANLRKDLQAWRGKPFTAEELKKFTITKLLGVPCQLGVIHKVSKKGKTYAEVTSILGVAKGTTVPPLVNPKLHFDFDNFNLETFQQIPEWLRKQIQLSPEYLNAMGDDPRQDDQHREEDQGGNGDDVPF